MNLNMKFFFLNGVLCNQMASLCREKPMEGLRQIRALAQHHPKRLTKSLHPFCYKICSEVLKTAFCPLSQFMSVCRCYSLSLLFRLLPTAPLSAAKP